MSLFTEKETESYPLFFITYTEDAIIFPKRNGYNHSTFTGKTVTPLWEASEDKEQEKKHDTQN